MKRNDDQGGFNRNIKPRDYYYYPSSNTYYSVSTGNYYYRQADEWKKTTALPSRYALDSRDRVKVRSTNKPYINNRVHKVEYKNRAKYGKDNNRDREERSHNKKWHWKSNKK